MHFKNIKKHLGNKPASTIALSLLTISSISLLAIGVITITTDTYEVTKKIEQSNVAYFNAETGIEYAMFNISGHLPGYEIDDNNISIKTRIYALSNNTLTVPAPDNGSDSSNSDWNEISIYQSSSIPLYVDNSHLISD